MAVPKNDAEKRALDKLKENLKDVLKPHHDDDYLLRWLVVRKFDVSKAEAMFRENLAFREKVGADTIAETWQKPEVIKQYFPGGVCGFDREGGPLKVELYGKLDMRGMMYSCKRLDLEKYRVHDYEKIFRTIKEQEEKLQKSIRGMTVVFDMEGVSASTHLWKPGVVMYMHLVSILDNNYPEMLKRLLVVNAPRIFPILYRLAKPFMSSNIKKKIHVLGSNYKDKLLKYIDEENLPEHYGGKLRDENGDPRCSAMTGTGGKIPEKFYLRELCVSADMESKVVAKGAKIKLDYEVEKPGSFLRWEFKSEENDIGFGVQYKAPKSDETKTLIPIQRHDCHIVPFDGILECDEPGTYTVIFDNSFSWTKDKKIWYNIEITTEDEQTGGDLDEVAEGGNWDEVKKTDTVASSDSS